MPKRTIYSLLISLLCLALLAACASLQGAKVFPAKHPEDLAPGKRPTCTGCHESRSESIDYARYDHTVFFADSHRQEAYRNEQLCAMCHATSFCNDCHATRVELKPSLRNQTDNFRQMPHRGDYLSRHVIDGRMDPTSCFRCHGNPKSAISCKSCHG